ncbi:MAG TPA: LAGLIDADG family homing endonuclease [Candidatus Paceibacterota bacterium]|nr:LAGLIDADG family homing endonuclease [Candidatus Paceibacterota bacterium]
MTRRGPKPKGSVKIEWSANFAYAIGLIASDGCLYNDGRHISITSKDLEQIENFKKCLDLPNKIASKHGGGPNYRYYYHLQIGDRIFYSFLESIGFMPAKSKVIGKIILPDEYFFDFLRGSFDGDGTFYSYWDKRWRSRHMFYLEFISASKNHIVWIREEIYKRLGVSGYVAYDGKHLTLQLKYAKREALEIIRRMYYNREVICLSRKRGKIEKAVAIERKQQKQYLLTK